MKITKRHNVRLYPNIEQQAYLIQNLGNYRWVYNQSLAYRQSFYAAHGKNPSTKQVNEHLAELKEEHEWLKLSDSASLQQALRDLDDAYSRFFKHQNEEPVFKSKKGKNSFRTPYNGGNARVEGNGLKIPKLRKPISFRGSPLPKEYKLLSVTIELTKCGKWITSLCIETEVKQLPKTGKQVGVDLGLTDLMILSDGTKIPAPKFGRKYQIKLAKEQRKLSKMRDRAKKEGRKPGSNYRKQQRKVAKLQAKIANCRKDYGNKASKWLVENYDLIALEDLNVKGLQKNHKLAYSIADASWSSLVNMILYKAMWYGKTVIQIGQFQPTSTVCSECGTLHKGIANSLEIREWVCPDCNTWHDRDVNAAINILNYALA